MKNLVDPLTGDVLMKIPGTTKNDTEPLIRHMKSCPKTGLHNPFKNKERYLQYADVNRKLVECFSDKEVFEFFVKCV